MRMAMTENRDTDTSQNSPTLQLVPGAPESTVRPFNRDHFSEGKIAIKIGELATDIKEEYQRNFSASNADIYDMKRGVKRRIMAARIFQAFNMLDTVVPNPATEAVEDTPKESPEGKYLSDKKRDEIQWPSDIPEDFATEYAAREKQLEQYDRGQLIDLVDEYYEHPVIRTTLVLGRITEKGPLSEDSVAVQRVAALMIRSME